MARTLTKAEDATRQTYTGTTDYQNALGVVAWQPAADTDYLIIWRGLADNSNAASSTRVQLYNETTATSLDEMAIACDAVSGPSDLGAVGGIKRLQFGASPSAQTLRLRFKTHNSASTAGVQDLAIYVLQMTDNDRYAEQLSTISTTSTSYQTAITLTWTPSGTKDYLIIHDGKIRNSASGADDAALRFRKGSTTIAEASPIGLRDNGSGRAALLTFVKQSLSGSQTWTSEYKAVAAGTSSYGSGAICALYLEDFEGNTYAEQAAEVTTASASAQTAASIAPTLTANDYLILACALSRNSSANTPTMVSLTQDGTALITESAREDETGDQHYYMWWAAYHATFTAGSKTFAVRYRNSSADGTARLGSIAIAALQLTAASAALPAPDIADSVYLRNTLVIDDIFRLDTGAAPATDPDTVEIVEAPLHGAATVAGLYINYLPDQGYLGDDTFTYRYANAGGTYSNTATVTVTTLPHKLMTQRQPFVRPQGIGTGAAGSPATADGIAAGDTPTGSTSPTATDDTYSTEFNTALDLNVLSNDLAGSSAIDPSSVEVLTDPAHGVAVHSGNGTITYTPTAGFSGRDSFQYQVHDAAGRVSNAATVQINVLEAPIPVSFTNGYSYRSRFRIPAARHGGVSAMIFTYDETKASFKSVANGGLVENSTHLDVRFENANGTQLAHRIVAYDATTGRLRASVLIAPSSGVDYGGFVYVGKAGLGASEQNAAGVYTGTIGAWSLETGASLIGGTALTLTGTATGSAFDDGLTTDGSASYASLATGLSTFTGQSALTVELFAKAGAGSVDSDHGLVVLGPSGGADDHAATFFVRFDDVGFNGSGTNVITAGCRTGDGAARIESASGVQDTSAHHYAYIWQAGVLPKLLIDGVATTPTWRGKVSDGPPATNTADVTVGGVTVLPASGDLRVGVGPKGSATGSFIGELAELRIWPQVQSDARIKAEQLSFLYPSRFYGTGQVEQPNVNQGPVAMPVYVALSKNAADIDIDVKTLGGFEPDGQSLTLSSVGTPSHGSASVVSGKARYNVDNTFVGTDTFTYTISDGSASSIGTVVVTVTDAGSGTNAGAYEYINAFPWLPSGSGETNIDVWNVPAAGGSNTAAGDVTKLLLVVLPDDFQPTKTVVVSGAGGNGTLYRGVVIVGGSLRRSTSLNAIPPSGTTATFPNGLPGGHIFSVKFKNDNAAWGSVRPFLWMSNLLVDTVDADGNRLSYWGDFLRVWHVSGGAEANAPNVYIQKLLMPNGVWGYSAQAPLVGVDKEAPHSDLIQIPSGKANNFYIAEVDWEHGYQGLFLSPSVANPGQGGYPTATSKVFLDKMSMRMLGAKTTDPTIGTNTRFSIKISSQPSVDFPAGDFFEIISSKAARDAAPTTYTPTVWLQGLTTAPDGDVITPTSIWTYGGGLITSGTTAYGGRYPLSDGSGGPAKFYYGVPSSPVVDPTHTGDDVKITDGTTLRAKMA